MSNPIDLELTIRGEPALAEARLTQSDGRSVATFEAPLPPPDLVKLREAAHLPDDYGQLLCELLFGPQPMRTAWDRALALAAGRQLRLRLDLRPAPLYALHWETLRDPLDGLPLAFSERVLLSRWLPVADTRLAASPLGPPTRTLVVVAGPDDLPTFNLAPVDIAGEATRASAALHGLGPEVLARSAGRAATLEQLAASLRLGPQIVYIACHGALVDDQPYLWLERRNGQGERVAGTRLAELFASLPAPPPLVVLGSCDSAGGRSGEAALAALGPRLVRAGVAAVVAMQGPARMASVARLMPALFAALRSHGQIDQALAAARLTIRDQPDWWSPCLISRLRTGQLWQPATPPTPAPRLGGLHYDRGLHALRAHLAGDPQRLSMLETLADRLHDNLSKEQTFGSTETRRSERSEIIYSLNALAFETMGRSFNQLCAG